MKLQIVIEKEPGGQGYHAYCPALKGCHTCGETKQEAIRNLKEAIALYLEPEEAVLQRELRLHRTLHPQIISVAI